MMYDARSKGLYDVAEVVFRCGASILMAPAYLLSSIACLVLRVRCLSPDLDVTGSQNDEVTKILKCMLKVKI